jgi:prepilin-type N-terminal cleavage/methylation domain-containing protein
MKHSAAYIPRVTLGFSLIELVIVVVIIGIIGAVAVPRMSRGSEGAAVSALTGNLAVMNKAVDHYAAEHGGDFPRAADITDQLLKESNTWGNTPTGAPGEVVYGPYLRTIPPLPIGEKKGNAGLAAADGPGVGWLYAPARGIIRPNLTKTGGVIDEAMVTNVINGSRLGRDDLVKE